jgi:hypothetical protein
MEVERRVGEQIYKKEHLIKLVVKRSPRTTNNPYGLKIMELKELN